MNPKSYLVPNLYDTKNIKQVPTRNGYGEGLVLAGEQDQNVVALCCDLTESTRTQAFKEKFPSRFFEIGVAEQNMMGIAAGLALSGKIPFISSYAVFSPGRNWDQLRVSVCYSQANVKIMGAHAGISVGPDGATHQALEDIAITRVLPNLTVICPADYEETKKAVIQAAKIKVPVYVRFGREKTPAFTTQKTPFKIGKIEVLRFGRDVTIIACGSLVYEALLAAEILAKQKIYATVLNCHTIKPIDKQTLIYWAKKTGAVITAEEHQITGGLGGAVAEVLSQNHPVPIKIIGVPDKFGESGEPRELMESRGLTAQNIIKKAKEVMKLKKKR